MRGELEQVSFGGSASLVATLITIQQTLQQLTNNQMNHVPAQAPAPTPLALEPILDESAEGVTPVNADYLLVGYCNLRPCSER